MANCHLLRHLIKRSNEWVVDTKELTPRELIDKLYEDLLGKNLDV